MGLGTKSSYHSDGFEKDVLDNPWHKTYWFARMLINSDKYGGIGKDSKLLAGLSSQLRIILDDKKTKEIERFEICRKLIREILFQRYSNSKVLFDRVKLFCSDLELRIETPFDLEVFVLTLESIMIPINGALSTIPNNDKEFTVATAKVYLDQLGLHGLATVINKWDDLGVNGCLTAERVAVVREFAKLRDNIREMPDFESNLILTAFVQEFERRLGQKRKGRAGGSLEDVASFLFDYYHINASNAPEHFQADIEIDKWITCADKWLIGISCKRTLRERWKQVSSADRNILSKFKIKQIWHLITYDEDLSDDKLTLLGSLGHVFYLKDDSRILKRARGHIGMKKYVRPMSSFIGDINREQKK